jgi:hypothetical protein
MLPVVQYATLTNGTGVLQQLLLMLLQQRCYYSFK